MVIKVLVTTEEINDQEGHTLRLMVMTLEVGGGDSEKCRDGSKGVLDGRQNVSDDHRK